MFTSPVMKIQMLVMSLLAALMASGGRTAKARRGAEFIEIALYAVIILALFMAFRAFLPGAFDALLGDVVNALGFRYGG